METVIDWNEAPEWATGHGLIAFQGITRVWFNDEQYAVYDRDGGPYPWGGGKGDTRHNHTRSAIEYPTNRPAPWTGEDLPPVGMHVVVHDDGSLIYGQGESGEVLAHVDGCAVIRMSYGLGCFRPRCLRTPEQVAAEEREKEAQELFEILNPEGKWHKFDNNGKDRYRRAAIAYRKQVAP